MAVVFCVVSNGNEPDNFVFRKCWNGDQLRSVKWGQSHAPFATFALPRHEHLEYAVEQFQPRPLHIGSDGDETFSREGSFSKSDAFFFGRMSSSDSESICSVTFFSTSFSTSGFKSRPRVLLDLDLFFDLAGASSRCLVSMIDVTFPSF